MTMAETENQPEHVEPVELTEDARSLGVERWVQFAFIAIAAVAFWLLDHVIWALLNYFVEPDATLVTAVSGALAIILAFVLYRVSSVREEAHNVVAELAKVTWPTRDETWSATLVVVITSIVASIIMFGFDAAWSSITDLIYKTKV